MATAAPAPDLTASPATRAKGPFTRRRQRRAMAIYAGLIVVGAVLAAVGSPGLQAFGVGLWFPGAGFLAVGGWASLLVLASLLLFALTLVAWAGAGANTFPPAAWLVGALGAASVATDGVSEIGIVGAAAILLAGVLAAAVGAQRGARAMAERRAQRLAVLPTELARARARGMPTPDRGTVELGERDLQMLRYVFDRALQPVGQFEGYDVIDQFQTAAIRYQINQFGYALAVMQAHYTPNFHGYGTQAQRQLIETYLTPKVWSYWKLENAWGNLRFAGDPVPEKDNIMLTGYYGLQVALYTGLTGDERYRAPGSLTFASRRKRYEHSLETIVESIVANFRRNEVCLYPCEPNWLYSACNFRALAGLQAYDRVAGTGYFEETGGRFREHLEAEFVNPDLSVVAMRSQLTGLPVPFPLPDGTLTLFLHSMYPDLAERAWAFVRTESFAERDGRLTAKLPSPAIDVSRYKPGYGQGLETAYGASKEMGDAEAAAAALAAMDEHCDPHVENGAFGYRGAGNAINGCMALDQMLHHSFWAKTVLDPVPESTLHGPVLDDAAYPNVLVAKAISAGDDLELVLHSGRDGGVERLGLARLQPGRRYRETSTSRTVTGDAEGRASIEVELRGRTALHLVPEAA
jgi:hypothetical protein